MAEVISLNPEHPRPDSIARAAAIIRGGGLVAFPTETVYGLGADALNENAVRKIFEAKGRPSDNPLIVHVASRQMLDRIAVVSGNNLEKLIERFWPGPLTLVLERRPEVTSLVSAGLTTVAVRMPSSKIALELIKAADTPIAAPSANISGRPSATSAAHVEEDLGAKIDLILDGGETTIGIESTVLDLTSEPPLILRPGWVSREALSELIGQVDLAGSDDSLRRSPGTRHRHYSPRAQLVLVEQGSGRSLEEVCREYLSREQVGLISHSRVSISDPAFRHVSLADSAESYARSIYSAMRELDAWGADTIIVEGIADTGEGAAVMDRLRRAASQVGIGIRPGVGKRDRS